MRELILMMGLPRSGKSTKARELAHELRAPIVNPDSIRLALHGKRFEVLAEDFVWAIAKTMVRSLFLAGHKTVIVDATNTTRRRRDFWKPGESDEWQTLIYLVNTDAATCRDRAGDDEVLKDVIHRMAECWESPGVGELIKWI